MKYAIGIDIGGTKISMILGSSSGRILASRVIRTRTGNQTQACLNELISNLQTLIRSQKVSKKNLLGIGIGMPGPVNSRLGVVPFSPHLRSWKGVPLARILKLKLRLPVVMANDANVAALGEQYFGQGKGVRDFIYMTVSTGIGGGLMIHGKLLEGCGYVAGEIGHMAVAADGAPCKCGKKGCLEAYASGTSMARYAGLQLKKGRKSKIKKLIKPGEKLSARILGRAAKKRDALALETYRRGGKYLGIGVANLLNILNPQKIILGGGVWKSAPPDLMRAMKASCREHAWSEAYQSVKIVRSRLRDHVGNLGALALAFDKLPKR